MAGILRVMSTLDESAMDREPVTAALAQRVLREMGAQVPECGAWYVLPMFVHVFPVFACPVHVCPVSACVCTVVFSTYVRISFHKLHRGTCGVYPWMWVCCCLEGSLPPLEVQGNRSKRVVWGWYGTSG